MINLESIEKNKIIEIMFNLFLVVPIFWLTNIIYVYKYGNYIIDMNWNHILEFKFWITIIWFAAILILSFLLESIILPYIVIFNKNKDLKKKDIELKIFISYLCNSLFGINIYNLNYKSIGLIQRSFYGFFYKIPVALLLYSICLISISIFASIILMILSIVFIILMTKVLIIYAPIPISTVG
jgi:hypothetical protein